ncbi:MAG: hypothetical protein M3Z09_03600 [Acidobacteriota bacterium]|nr:hypothetical protein [Acidobacteriota bacterium]
MRITPILAGLLLLGLSQAQADEHDECKQEIKRLQERLDLLEAKLEVLTQNPTPAQTPAEHVQNVAASLSPLARGEVTPPELIPEIGKIGAEVGLVLSGSANPFHLNQGQDAAGYIDLPLFEPKALHGKLGYEIRVGLSQAKTRFQTTSNVAQVANLAALNALRPNTGAQNIIDSVQGTGAAPFPVTALTETRSKLLQVIPFALRYTATALDRYRLRPYAVLGFGTFVTIHNQQPIGTGVRPDAGLTPAELALINQVFGGKAPFGGPLVAGQISQSPELEARGLPGGHGNIDFGIHTGGGVEVRLSRGFSLGFDARYNRISGGQRLATYGTKLGFHF